MKIKYYKKQYSLSKRIKQYYQVKFNQKNINNEIIEALPNYQKRILTIKSTACRSRLYQSDMNVFKNFSHLYELNSNTVYQSQNAMQNYQLEIGFGNGESLIYLANKYKDDIFIGIEIFPKGIAQLIKKIVNQDIKNIKYCYGDARFLLNNTFHDNFFKDIRIYFPDPWFKKRHHKRRLIQNDFVNVIAKKLRKQDGKVHLATDCENYSQQMMKIFQQNNEQFENAFGNNNFATSHDRSLTKYEQKNVGTSTKIYDLLFKVKNNSSQ